MSESRCPACTCIGFHTGDCTLDEMTLRDRIAKLLHEETWFRLPERESGELADAILAIPGIAVVELPSFDSIEDDFGVVDNKVRHYLPSGFGAYREYRLNDARDLAAALLAAADYAERDQ